MSTTIAETKQFADLAALPWRFDVFNGTDIQVMDANGRLVCAETFEAFQKHGEDYIVAFEAWQQTKVRWQFIVHASQLFPQMFGAICGGSSKATALSCCPGCGVEAGQRHVRGCKEIGC